MTQLREVDPIRVWEREAEQHAALLKFFRWAMTEGSWDGCDLDGASVQDKAEELGLIVKVPYDPAQHGTRGADEFDVEPGDDWYVFAPGIK